MLIKLRTVSLEDTIEQYTMLCFLQSSRHFDGLKEISVRAFGDLVSGQLHYSYSYAEGLCC